MLSVSNGKSITFRFLQPSNIPSETFFNSPKKVTFSKFSHSLKAELLILTTEGGTIIVSIFEFANALCPISINPLFKFISFKFL